MARPFLVLLKNILLGIFFFLLVSVAWSSDTKSNKKIKSFEFQKNENLIAYGYYLYQKKCLQCHSYTGGNYLNNRIKSPPLAGLSGQEVVDKILYYRDAESYGIQLTGKGLIMSRHVLSISNQDVKAISSYLHETYN